MSSPARLGLVLLSTLAAAAACGGSGSSAASGVIDQADWTFGAGIYTTDAQSPPDLQVILSRDPSIACRATGATGSGESAILLLLPAAPASLTTTTTGEATADYDDANAESATMSATFSDLALGSDGLLSGSIDASDGDGDSISGTFTARSCD